MEPTDEAEIEPEPSTYKAALRSPQARQWKEAMRQEWQALVDNHTFDIVEKGNTVHTPTTDRTVVSDCMSLFLHLSTAFPAAPSSDYLSDYSADCASLCLHSSTAFAAAR